MLLTRSIKYQYWTPERQTMTKTKQKRKEVIGSLPQPGPIPYQPVEAGIWTGSIGMEAILPKTSHHQSRCRPPRYRDWEAYRSNEHDWCSRQQCWHFDVEGGFNDYLEVTKDLVAEDSSEIVHSTDKATRGKICKVEVVSESLELTRFILSLEEGGRGFV